MFSMFKAPFIVGRNIKADPIAAAQKLLKQVAIEAVEFTLQLKGNIRNGVVPGPVFQQDLREA